ncbi:hypothetical protein DL546_006016 [Coniochaeta pulveracea]|uniref:Uncharacterized protein n=1 Tax=Coniochaeta pulveracea TaxID=177199 RepID=A0A420YJD1_9PEZI|nr:hypothetical protein DL546_006016 [Coniochaeta pulveracea]
MSDTEQTPVGLPLLLLYSHARTNPISHPDLKYDLRSVSNPPKQIRDKYSGIDKRVQEYMRGHGDFVALVDRAEGEIRALMGLAVSAAKATDAGHLDGADEEGVRYKLVRPATTSTGITGVDGAERVVGDGEEAGSEEEEEEDVDGGEGEDDDEEEEDGDRPRLRVSVFDVRGRHRSVAFVEELKSRDWPDDWEVRVVHRDLAKGRKGSVGGYGNARRNSLGRGFLGQDDDE